MPESHCAEGLNCDLIVFDLDGTLIDSQQDLSNSVNATLAFLKRPALHDRRIAEFIGDGASMLVRRAMEATGGVSDALMADALPFFLEYYRAHNLDFTYVYPGVMAELRRLRQLAPMLPMAVLTNKPFRPSRVICDGLGLSPFFFQNYGGDSFPLKKPDPFGMNALIKEATAMLGRQVTAARTVLIGDSHVDTETARNAGALSLGCSYGLSPERLLESKPDHIVDSPTGWIDGLRKLLP